jgi:hypothetical protein
VHTRHCAYQWMWAELRRWLDEDQHSVPGRATASARNASRSRRYHADRLLALMDQLEAEGRS